MKVLQEWFYDVCGKVITSPGEGYVFWKRDKNNKDFDYIDWTGIAPYRADTLKEIIEKH